MIEGTIFCHKRRRFERKKKKNVRDRIQGPQMREIFNTFFFKQRAGFFLGKKIPPGAGVFFGPRAPPFLKKGTLFETGGGAPPPNWPFFFGKRIFFKPQGRSPPFHFLGPPKNLAPHQLWLNLWLTGKNSANSGLTIFLPLFGYIKVNNGGEIYA